MVGCLTGLLVTLEIVFYLWITVTSVYRAISFWTIVFAICFVVYDLVPFPWGENDWKWYLLNFFEALGAAVFVYFDVVKWMIMKGRYNLKITEETEGERQFRRFPYDTYIFCALLLYVDILRLALYLFYLLGRCVNYCFKGKW